MVKREHELPTGMPHGWALPHCRHQSIKQAVLAVGTCPSGIDFACPDGSQATLLIMLATPVDAADQHLQSLAAVARVFKHGETFQEIQNASTPNELRAAIRHAESDQKGHSD